LQKDRVVLENFVQNANRTERKCDGSQFATNELSECAGDNIAAEE
jgi:hypothetical protein